LEKTHILTPL